MSISNPYAARGEFVTFDKETGFARGSGFIAINSLMHTVADHHVGNVATTVGEQIFPHLDPKTIDAKTIDAFGDRAFAVGLLAKDVAIQLAKEYPPITGKAQEMFVDGAYRGAMEAAQIAYGQEVAQ